jgi:GH15 family glucan-1,4-alpha-glucosidase
VDAIRDALSLDGGLLRRYASPDDFGVPEAAFTVCSFWLVEALAILERTDEARELFERLLGFHNGLGLFSEDLLPGSHEQTGNFPQTYTHVGLINAAFRLSRRWD